MASIEDIARDFTDRLRAGQIEAARDEYWAADVISVEPGDAMGGGPVAHRRNPIWSCAYGIDDLSVDGPFITGDQFALFIDMVIVDRASGETRPFTEIALYTVRDAKIAEERYFYD